MHKVVRIRFIGAIIFVLIGSTACFLTFQMALSYCRGTLDWQPDREFLLFAFAGFVAQIIDGALGMAYGVSCSSLLIGFGLPPAVASASVHTAEVFTTGASGISHLYFKNINKKLFLKLLIPGLIGAMLGAYLVSSVFDGKVVKPFVSAYLLILGVIVLRKAFQKTLQFKETKRIPVLGLFGGFLDAVGGGGWGPIVSSTLIGNGHAPNRTIGTVNTVEFFVAFAGTGVFLFFLSVEAWKPIMGLVLGGLIAAPLGALVVKLIQPKLLMKMVGVLIILVSTYNLLTSLKLI